MISCVLVLTCFSAALLSLYYVPWTIGILSSVHPQKCVLQHYKTNCNLQKQHYKYILHSHCCFCNKWFTPMFSNRQDTLVLLFWHWWIQAYDKLHSVSQEATQMKKQSLESYSISDLKKCSAALKDACRNGMGREDCAFVSYSLNKKMFCLLNASPANST